MKSAPKYPTLDDRINPEHCYAGWEHNAKPVLLFEQVIAHMLGKPWEHSLPPAVGSSIDVACTICGTRISETQRP